MRRASYSVSLGDGVLGIDDVVGFQSLSASERVFCDDSLIGTAGVFDLVSLASTGGRRTSNSENSLPGRLACNRAVSLVWNLAMKLSQFSGSRAMQTDRSGYSERRIWGMTT